MPGCKSIDDHELRQRLLKHLRDELPKRVYAATAGEVDRMIRPGPGGHEDA